MEQELINYIVSLVPAITAILTALATMITIFIRIKQLTDTSNKETKQMKAEISVVLKEIAELKGEMTKVLKNVYMVADNGEDK